MMKDAESTVECYVYVQIDSKFDAEVGRYVAGSPQLNVWSQGDTRVEAMTRARDAILFLLDETTQMGTVFDILRESGIKPITAVAPPSRGPGESWLSRMHYLFTSTQRLPERFPLNAIPCH
jgi:predicted RNase H-like HicB family nuclease